MSTYDAVPTGEASANPMAVKDTTIDADLSPRPRPAVKTPPSAVPPQKFKGKVVARDKDGMCYDAVIRRAIYGAGQAEPIQLGLCSHAEAQALLQDRTAEVGEDPPCWHYFVHFTKWSAMWDRWVAEFDIYEPSDAIQTYAQSILNEQKKLRQEMTRKVKGKKNFQTIDGVKFLQEWRKRVHKVDAELGIENPRFGATASSASELETGKDKTKTSNRTRAKATLLAERKQREKSLTGNRKDATANKIVLPFGLKRALVEQWEIITQCGNLTALPASVTIRQALNEYLRSKGVDPVVSHCAARLVVEESAVADFQATPIDGSAEIKTSIRMISETTESKTREDYIGQGNEVETPENSNALQGWREMADGIAQFFDEALPHRLLYREEYAQLQVLERLPQLDNKPYSEIYGCEYLLRLFTRLPVILTNDLPPEDSRAVFAKLNDLVRFLYKNQSTLFAAHHRKPIKDEHLEAARIESKQLKKKRREEPAQGHIDKKRKLKEGKKS